MAERDAAAVRVDVRPTVGQPRVVHELQRHRRERLVDLDHGDVVPRQAGTPKRALARLRIPVEHPVRTNPDEPEGDEPRPRAQPEPLGRPLAHHEHGGGAVADLARVSGRHLSIRDERRLQRSQGLGRRVRARRLVDVEDNPHVRIREVDRHDLVVEVTVLDRCERPAV
jgi:hypothetical protein